MNYNKDPRRQSGGYGPLDEPQVKRTYTPEEAGHEKHRKPVTRLSYNSRRRKRPKINGAVVVISVIFLLIIGLCVFLLASGKNKTSPSGNMDPTVPAQTDENGLSSTDQAKEDLPYITVQLSERGIYYGDLILVNSYNEYWFPEEMENAIVPISEAKGEYCLTSGNSESISSVTMDAFNRMTEDFYNATGFRYLQLNSAYRSHEHQEALYAQYEKDYGADYARKYVADPGFSEHHTGLGVDLNVNKNGVITYVESDEGCLWFRENCSKYGFVLRYPDDKVDITGISYESWHYRYVGVPHAQIMKEMNFCLEEYIDYVKGFTYDTKLLNYSEELGVTDMSAEEFYEADSATVIYYVPGAEKYAEALVPKDCEYTVSGNNIDGFIITCVK